MANKKISFQVGNVGDGVTAIGTTAYDDTTVQELADSNTGYWLEANRNGQTDLCTEVDDTTPDIDASFVEMGTNNPYTTISYDFDLDVIGGRPHTRCPKCVF